MYSCRKGLIIARMESVFLWGKGRGHGVNGGYVMVGTCLTICRLYYNSRYVHFTGFIQYSGGIAKIACHLPLMLATSIAGGYLR